MVNAWPATVPTSAIVGSLKEAAEDDVNKYVPMRGPPRKRNTSTIVTSVLKWQTPAMTTAARQALETFFLANRALTFTRVHPHPAITGTKFWQFEEPPDWSDDPASDFHSVTLTLRLLPGNP